MRFVVHGFVLGGLLALTGCPEPSTPESSRPPQAQKWFERAVKDYQVADIDEARDSVQKALAIVPQDPELKTLAASIALAKLDYAEVARLLKDVHGPEAAGLRGRALWYKGELDGAADELESMLNDPEVKDEWAKSISKLARRGAGRTPFQTSGAVLANVDLVHVSPQAPLFIVPVEIDGEAALAMVATATAEVVLDSSTRPEPSWVSLRFGGKLEVHDVPALAEDLSGISKQLGAPVKAMLGVNLLRHLNVTFDYTGRQFIARSYAPPPPPNATRLDLFYIKGAGMVARGGLGGERGVRASLLLDTAMVSPIALDKDGWQKAGVDVATLQAVKDDPSQKLRVGTVPVLRLGAFDVQQVPGEYGLMPIDKLEKQLSLEKERGDKSEKLLPFDLDGVLGAGLLAHYRLTLGDDGRYLWMEDDSAVERMLNGGVNAPPAPIGLPPALPPGAPTGPVNLAQPPPPLPPPPAPTDKPPPSPSKQPQSSNGAGPTKPKGAK